MKLSSVMFNRRSLGAKGLSENLKQIPDFSYIPTTVQTPILTSYQQQTTRLNKYRPNDNMLQTNTIYTITWLLCEFALVVARDLLRDCLYEPGSPVSRANSLNEVLITATTDTQNDISKQNWLSLTVGRA